MKKGVKEGNKEIEKPSGSGEAPSLQEVKCLGLTLQRRGSMKEIHLGIIMPQASPVKTQETLDQSACMIKVEEIMETIGTARTCGST